MVGAGQAWNINGDASRGIDIIAHVIYPIFYLMDRTRECVGKMNNAVRGRFTGDGYIRNKRIAGNKTVEHIELAIALHLEIIFHQVARGITESRGLYHDISLNGPYIALIILETAADKNMGKIELIIHHIPASPVVLIKLQ